jgi:osmotically-inducible protein OsmY
MNIIKKMINKLTVKEIAEIISQNKDISKKVIYNYCLKLKMKSKFILFIIFGIILSSCVGVSSKGVFGTGVSIAFDPRTVGTQMDDSIMQKNLAARILIKDKKYLLSVKSKVLDGRIFLTGKVDSPEEKLLLTKLAWEIKGARSVRNDIKVKKNLILKDLQKIF